MNANTEDNRNSQVILRQVPTGLLGPDDFEVRQAPMPTAGDGEVVVEAHYLSLDAALRLIVRDSKDFLFRVEPGDLVRNSVAGQVVESNNPDWAAGDYVVAATGVQNYGISDGSDLELCDITQAPLSAWLGGFGVSGLTAYFAIFDECKPQPGQTVVVNGAAGAVGTMAGQFAKMAGARVIGIAGGPEKCKWLVDELGFDAAVDYKDGDLYEKLVEAAPDRIDFIFDNVGGSVLNESLRWIALRGKVLLCGSTSQYSEEEISGPSQYIWLGTMRASIQGYVVYDYADRFDIARKHMAQWRAEGRLSFPEHVYEGDVPDFGQAFHDLYSGRNKGKMVVKLPAADT